MLFKINDLNKVIKVFELTRAYFIDSFLLGGFIYIFLEWKQLFKMRIKQ
ncbi:hypothetical protein WPG_3129 [Winogradskyella sp. PG-2]|nr:hypothetical protein WPG_3129 [Winogradskyella sp. PG-2]